MASKRKNDTKSKVPLDTTSTEPSKQYTFCVRDKICEQLYLNPEISDVSFLFPSKDDQSEANKQRANRAKKPIVSIPAHKIFLKTESKVFREMFNGTWKETKEVEIVDATPEAFKEFLQCFYLGSGTFTKQNIDRVMYLADKYMIDDCLVAIVQFLKDSFTLDDVVSCYTLSILYKQPNLKEICEEKIKLNTQAVFESEDFLDCDRDILTELLKLDLNCKETDVFEGCMKWAKNGCKKNSLDENSTDNLRAQLGECLYLIRFGSMTLEELCQRNLKYRNLLRDNELIDAMNCIGLKEYKSKIFVQKPQLDWNESQIWRCKVNVGMFSHGLRRAEIVQITSNKTTLLSGFYWRYLYHVITGRTYSTLASIEIIEKSSASEDVLFSGTIHFNGICGPLLKFAKPILIKEGFKYEIRLGFKEHIGVPICKMFCGKVVSPKGLEINFESENLDHLISGLDLMDV